MKKALLLLSLSALCLQIAHAAPYNRNSDADDQQDKRKHKYTRTERTPSAPTPAAKPQPQQRAQNAVTPPPASRFNATPRVNQPAPQQHAARPNTSPAPQFNAVPTTPNQMAQQFRPNTPRPERPHQRPVTAPDLAQSAIQPALNHPRPDLQRPERPHHRGHKPERNVNITINTPDRHHHSHGYKHHRPMISDNFNFYLFLKQQRPRYSNIHYHPYLSAYDFLAWKPYHGFIPNHALIGGYQGSQPLYVCHAEFAGGLHPGKVWANRCNISYGGREYAQHNFSILIDNYHNTHWEHSANGYVPENAIAGGYEEGRELFICRASYRHGKHIGKVVGEYCNFGWGGDEILRAHYEVLVG